MSRHFRLLPLAAAFLAAPAAAQAPAPAYLGAVTPAAPLSYRSPIADYQSFTDESVISWKDANDTVGRIGGWREYARESEQRPAPSQAPDAAAAGTGPSGAATPGKPPGTPATPAPAPATQARPAAPAAPAAPSGHGGHQH